VDICVEELREAVKCFGKLLGKIDVEEILDVLFKDFCIGK
jgi:tRNA modification GTPase